MMQYATTKMYSAQDQCFNMLIIGSYSKLLWMHHNVQQFYVFWFHNIESIIHNVVIDFFLLTIIFALCILKGSHGYKMILIVLYLNIIFVYVSNMVFLI